MRNVGSDIQNMVARLGAGSESARLNLRIQQVRQRYCEVIEAIYRDTAQLHLAHTNTVIIRPDENGVKTLTVYVDDSLFAAELNAQRELIKLQLLERFGEEIDDFKIYTSSSKRYRDKHPFVPEASEKPDKKSPSIPLDSHEKSYVADTISRVDNEAVRIALEKAMTADMEWKKGERVCE